MTNWMTDDAKFKKAKKYTNVVHPLLLRGEKNKNMLKQKNNRTCKNSWSTLLGAVDKILKEIEKNLFENKECGL